MPSIYQEWVNELNFHPQRIIHQGCWMRGDAAAQKDAFASLMRWMRRCCYKLDDSGTVTDVPFDQTAGALGTAVPLSIVEDEFYATAYRNALSAGVMPRQKEEVIAELHKTMPTEWHIPLNMYVLPALASLNDQKFIIAELLHCTASVIAKYHPNILVRNWWAEFLKVLATECNFVPLDLDKFNEPKLATKEEPK